MSTDADRIFARSMIAARKRRDLSQAALAAAMTEQGFSWRQSTVYGVESGGRRVQLGEAIAVARILEVEFVDMLDPAGVDTRLELIECVDEYLRAAGVELAQAAGAAGSARAKMVELVERLASDGVEPAPIGGDIIVGTATEEFWAKRYRQYQLGQLLSYATELLGEDLGGTFRDEVKFIETNF